MSDPLRDELSRPEYAGMSDQDAADRVNGKRVTVRRPVPTWVIRREAISAGYWAAIVDARESPDTAVRRLAINVLSWIDDQSGVIQSIDMDAAPAVQIRAALVAAGLCTQQQADALGAMANAVIPWTESVGLPEVGVGLVRNARK